MADSGIAVIGAGVVGLAVAARLAPRHPDLVLLERNAAARAGDVQPEQRGDPRRDLLPAGLAEGAALRGGQPAPLRDVRPRATCPTAAAARSSPPPPRRSCPRWRRCARGPPPTGWSSSGSPPREAARPRAPRALRGRAPVARHRHRQRPRPHGRAPARRAPGRRRLPAAHGAGGPGEAERRLRADGEDGRRPGEHDRGAGGQRRGPGGGHGGGDGRDRRGRRRLPPALLQGQLLLGGPGPRGPRVAPGLSRARPRQPRRPRRAGPGRPAPLRPRRRIRRTRGRLPRRRDQGARVRAGGAAARAGHHRGGPGAGHERASGPSSRGPARISATS